MPLRRILRARPPAWAPPEPAHLSAPVIAGPALTGAAPGRPTPAASTPPATVPGTAPPPRLRTPFGEPPSDAEITHYLAELSHDPTARPRPTR